MKGLYCFTIVLLCVLLVPIFFIIAVCIALSGGWPVLYRQRRIGISGKPFLIYKFRTMRVGADLMRQHYASRNESRGPVFKIYNDPRFTTVGKFLSHTGLDELPQLYNVLRGEMALIGPRPLPVEEAKKLAPWMQERHDVLPGIISPAILTGRYHKDFNAWMKSDVAYVKTKKFWNDVGLGVRAVGFLLRLLAKELA